MRKAALILLVLPLAYLLSFPPLAVFMDEKPLGWTHDITYPLGPSWLVSYGRPYEALMKESPVRAPLRHYFDWWWLLKNP